MHQGLAARQATGSVMARSRVSGPAGRGLRESGQAEAGPAPAGRGAGGGGHHRGAPLCAELYRLQGELLLRQAVPDARQAEACFQQALAVARRQQAKSWELRAAMSLTRLWQRQGKRAEARELLRPIYGWFTEGFDTADLQDAKALLDEPGDKAACTHPLLQQIAQHRLITRTDGARLLCFLPPSLRHLCYDSAPRAEPLCA